MSTNLKQFMNENFMGLILNPPYFIHGITAFGFKFQILKSHMTIRVALS